MIGRIKKIYSIATTVLIVLVAAVAFLLAGVRLVGLTPYTVLSGSMEPKYHVGSLIYVEKVEPSEIEVGDPLTYRLANGTVVTHAVIEIIEGDSPANRQFITQGLANDIPDGAPVHAANVIGRPMFSIPYLGFVSDYVQRPSGMIVVVCAILAVLLLSFVPDVLSAGKHTETSEDADDAKGTEHAADEAAGGEEKNGNIEEIK